MAFNFICTFFIKGKYEVIINIRLNYENVNYKYINISIHRGKNHLLKYNLIHSLIYC